MKRTLLYSRVSTEEQAKGGHSLFFQQQQLEKYCIDHNIENFKYYEEDGKSGKNLNRPKIQKVFQEVLKGEVEKLVVLSMDRLTRSIEDYIKITKFLESFKIELVSLTENLTNDAMGEFVQHILIAKAQMERKVISERTKRGIEGGLEKGRYTLGGRLPLGISKTTKNKLYFNKDIKIVKYMFELDKKGYSYVEISKEIKRKYNITIDEKSKISRILNNTLYRGYREYNGKKYYFIEPIIESNYKDELVKSGNYKIINKRKRNLTSHNYLYGEYLKDFYVTTARKKLSTGEVKEYKYYKHKKSGFNISETRITKLIIKEMEEHGIKNKYNLEAQKRKINRLYVMGDISKIERDKAIYKLKNKKIEFNIKKAIKSLTIDDVGKFEVSFKIN